MCVINTQLASYCWMGNEIMYYVIITSEFQLGSQPNPSFFRSTNIQSNGLDKLAYYSNFVRFDRGSTRTLLILMQMMHRPIEMFARGLFNVRLSMPTYVAVVKTAYSNLMVLNTMND